MSLQAIAQRIKARSATPATSEKNMGLQPEPAPLLGRTLATSATPFFVDTRSVAANDARELDESQAERAAIMRFDGEIDAPLADLLALYGGYPSIDWQGLALTGEQESALWIVQRPDGLLTTLATVKPIPKPASYRQAWAARFISPEPQDDAAQAEIVQTAAQAVERARQSCWDCRHLDTTPRPTCGAGHSLCWRTINPGRRTMPSRADAEPCKDKRP
ncbi:MAG: hypothetical protein AB7S67_12285 [Thiomonas sp.]